jgi:hypothetical protein
MTPTNNDILGTDELSRPITRDQLFRTDGHVERLKLLSEIVGPFQIYLQDIHRLTEVQQKNVEYYRKKTNDLQSALSDLIKPDIEAAVENEMDRRSDSFIHEDNITDHLMTEITTSRRIRAEISEIASESIDVGDIKCDVKSDIERDLDEKITDAINDFDFGDILDDHTRDIDDKIVKRLVDEIDDDQNHPLVNAIARALAARLTK